MISDADIAWAAGLFEGEGCFSTQIQRGRYGPYAQASLQSNDRDVLERFQAIVGVGSISKRKARANCKDAWSWHTSTYPNIEHVGELFRPWLGERRTQRLNEVLAACSPLRPKEYAHG